MNEISTLKPALVDLHTPNPKIYWADMLASSVGGWCLLWLAIPMFPEFSLLWPLLIFGSAMLFYRAIAFEHEIVHLTTTWVKPFTLAWNVLVGIPFFLPAITYSSHLDHHRTKDYGTPRDPRYIFNGKQFRMAMVLPLFLAPLAFYLVGLRYLVLGPISMLWGGRFREWVLNEFALQKINFRYRADKMNEGTRRSVVRYEVICFLAWTSVIAMMCLRWIPWQLIPAMGAAVAIIFVCNHLRALAAHLYLSHGTETLTFRQQLEDSISIVGPCPLSPLFAPVGLRYHSLHHLVPKLPYHAMGQAHRRLTQLLPADHPYIKSCRRDLLSTLVEIWRLHDPRKETNLRGVDHVAAQDNTSIAKPVELGPDRSEEPEASILTPKAVIEAHGSMVDDSQSPAF